MERAANLEWQTYADALPDGVSGLMGTPKRENSVPTQLPNNENNNNGQNNNNGNNENGDSEQEPPENDFSSQAIADLAVSPNSEVKNSAVLMWTPLAEANNYEIFIYH